MFPEEHKEIDEFATMNIQYKNLEEQECIIKVIEFYG